MSEACETDPLSSAEIETHAARWLERRDRDGWSETDQSALDVWLAQSPAHEIAFWRLDAAWERTDRLIVLRHPKQDIVSPAPSRVRFPVLKAVAGLAAVLILAAVGTNVLQRSPEDRTFSTPLGGRETIAFADGSKIELNTSTVLRTRMTTAQRTVWLDKGEAYFQVKHDAAHPFIVLAGDHRVTDLGTEFSVRRDLGQLKVAVLQGRVRLGSMDGRQSGRVAVLTPGQVAAANADSMVVTKRSIQSLANELSWQQGVLVFDETALGEAAAEFNRYNRTQLVIKDPLIARLVIAGTLPTSDIEGFARLAQTVLSLHVEHQGNDIVISR